MRFSPAAPGWIGWPSARRPAITSLLHRQSACQGRPWCCREAWRSPSRPDQPTTARSTGSLGTPPPDVLIWATVPTWCGVPAPRRWRMRPMSPRWWLTSCTAWRRAQPMVQSSPSMTTSASQSATGMRAARSARADPSASSRSIAPSRSTSAGSGAKGGDVGRAEIGTRLRPGEVDHETHHPERLADVLGVFGDRPGGGVGTGHRQPGRQPFDGEPPSDGEALDRGACVLGVPAGVVEPALLAGLAPHRVVTRPRRMPVSWPSRSPPWSRRWPGCRCPPRRTSARRRRT